jgi:hypothetical protein
LEIQEVSLLPRSGNSQSRDIPIPKERNGKDVRLRELDISKRIPNTQSFQTRAEFNNIQKASGGTEACREFNSIQSWVILGDGRNNICVFHRINSLRLVAKTP